MSVSPVRQFRVNKRSRSNIRFLTARISLIPLLYIWRLSRNDGRETKGRNGRCESAAQRRQQDDLCICGRNFTKDQSGLKCSNGASRCAECRGFTSVDRIKVSAGSNLRLYAPSKVNGPSSCCKRRLNIARGCNRFLVCVCVLELGAIRSLCTASRIAILLFYEQSCRRPWRELQRRGKYTFRKIWSCSKNYPDTRNLIRWGN